MASGALGLDLRLVAGGMRIACRRWLRDVQALPADRHVSIRYEDLCAHPDVEVARILDRLGLPTAPARVPPRDNQSAVLPEVARYQSVIARKLRPYMDRPGYRPLELQDDALGANP